MLECIPKLPHAAACTHDYSLGVPVSWRPKSRKGKWESGENRIFHSIKKKIPSGAQNTWIQPDIKADVHRMILEAETKWQVKAKESHPPVCIPINSALNIAFSHQVSE